jgi:WS/DGAT/MGAT family acyltransferase
MQNPAQAGRASHPDSQQLSPMDAVFLSLETPEIPGHIGGLAVLDPTSHPEAVFDYETFLEFVAERLPLCPRFGWRLQQVPLGLDEPYWVEHAEHDVSLHIQRVAVPSPGSMAELTDLASYLFARPLDRSLPLWEMFFIEGLQGGRVAMLWKVHHCMMDGVSGAGLVELLFDLQPVPGERPLVSVDERAEAGSNVGWATMAQRAVGNAARRRIAMLKHLRNVGQTLAGQVSSDGASGVGSAPKAPFNGVVGMQRSVATARISLERVKTLKTELGVTVNDVVLALTSDSVRRYLKSRGELPSESLVAAVPVSLRDEGDKSIGNKVSEISVSWSTDIEDPLERVRAIHEDAMRAKSSAKAERLNILGAMAESMAPGTLQLMMRAAAFGADSIPIPANAVVSNVPMSPVPLYIAGARIETMVPMSMLAPTQGFNITVLSYCGDLHFGLIADPNLVDNVHEIADGLPKALVELEAAANRDVQRS